jgi:1-acyl-sn-glycerol-3-phosphate acyltransferase
MTTIRSALFLAFAYLWTGALIVLYLPLLAVLPRRRMQPWGRLWCRGVLGLARICCGIRYRVVGREHLPAGPLLLAAKHQSAWDGLIFHQVLTDPVYVLKRELLEIPGFGLYLGRLGNIGIDRDAGFRAIKQMLPAVGSRLAEGAQVIVFPEGTRVAPGTRHPYHPGIAALYQRFDVPLVPVALNSGLLWGRDAFPRHPGTITIEFLPPMPRGLDRAAVVGRLEHAIETATDRLCGVTGGTLPGAPAVEPGDNR